MSTEVLFIIAKSIATSASEGKVWLLYDLFNITSFLQRLFNDMEKSRIKLFYKFPTNQRMRAGMGSVEYPPQSGQGEPGNQPVEVVGLISALNYTLCSEHKVRVN